MKFQIRKAETDADWDFFFKLGFETAKVLRKFVLDPFVKDNPEASDEEIFSLYRKETEDYFDFEHPEARVFIAETGENKLCGYLWMGMRNSKDVWDIENPQWIYDIVVDPTFRGHGLGKILMEKGEEFAKKLNLNLGLFVHENNTPAIALYKKIGYRIKQTPISKKLGSTITTDVHSNSITIREEKEGDQSHIWATELERFTEKVRFSADVGSDIAKKLYEEHIEKISKNGEKHQRLIAHTETGDLVGSIWVGSSGFNKEVAMIHELVIDSDHDKQLVGNLLVDSAEKWARNSGFSSIYVLHHTKEALDLDFFEERNYKVPGFFMEKRLKT
ncbi:MAG: GNAT family N-acetyltransferase [Candidatus Thorarchaeota archaeon]